MSGTFWVGLKLRHDILGLRREGLIAVEPTTELAATDHVEDVHRLHLHCEPLHKVILRGEALNSGPHWLHGAGMASKKTVAAQRREWSELSQQTQNFDKS